MRLWRILLALFLPAFYCAAAEASLDQLNLSQSLRRKIEDRRIIDRELEISHRAQGALSASPVAEERRRTTERSGVVVLRQTAIAEEEYKARAAVPEKVVPSRGYRAPLRGSGPIRWSATLPPDISEKERRAASLIAERLAFDGVLSTLVQVIQISGLFRMENDQGIKAQLARIGFPADLIGSFKLDGRPALDVIREHFAQNAPLAALSNALSRAEFDFKATQRGFSAIAENGELPLSRLRLQLRGGYENGGLVPGASLDFTENLFKALPEVQVIASIERPFAEFVRWHAAASWNLRRRGQLTLISEPLPVSAWARDNGVSGMVQRGSTYASAILTPRYASMGEAQSLLMPGESFLMDGLAQSGLQIIQSPILFQGGNVIVVHEPSGPRTLLLSERELARNIALGLKSNEVVRAFQIEFGADRAVVVPTCSYHLDYDVSLKTINGQIVALVNDPLSAAKKVVQIGLDTLATNNFLERSDVADMQQQMAREQWPNVATGINKRLDSAKASNGEYSERLSNCFRTSAIDAPGANLRTFFLALDLLGGTPEKPEYGSALARIRAALESQRGVLRSLGWHVAPIPSMPDLRWGANYINGLHGTRRYLMPAYGGFYAPLDQVAESAIHAALGDSVQIIPLLCAEMQRHYGAIHCMVSVLPPDR